MEKRLAIFVSNQVSPEYLKVLNILRDTFHWDIIAITTSDKVADMARTLLPVDRVYKIQSHVPFFQKEKLPLSDIVYTYRPQVSVTVGIPVRRIRRLLSQMTIPCIGIHLVHDPQNSMGDWLTQEIYPSFTPHIAFSQSEISIPPPYPQDEYQDQDQIRLFCHGDQEQRIAVYDIAESLGIDTTEERSKASISVFLDPLDFDTFGSMICDMSEGKIIIAPRQEAYVNCLGKGGLFYQPYSLSELQACFEILQKSSAKGQHLRQVLAEMYHKQYSYQAIAERWHRIFRNQLV